MSKWAPILALLFSIRRTHLHARERLGTSLKKLTSNNPNRLYFTTLDEDNLGGAANRTRFERGDW